MKKDFRLLQNLHKAFDTNVIILDREPYRLTLIKRIVFFSSIAGLGVLLVRFLL